MVISSSVMLVVVGIILLISWAARHGARDAAQRSIGLKTQTDAWMLAIESGSLPPISVDGIMSLENETFVYAQRARFGTTYQQRAYRGGNQAMYIPLGHGFRYRVGGTAGTSQNVTNFAWGPAGTVYVSNRRIVFKPIEMTDIAIAPYKQILAYDCYPDGLSLQVDGVGLMQFRTGDPVLGALFKKIIAGGLTVGTPSPSPSPGVIHGQT